VDSEGPGWQATLRVNLLGALVGARLAARAMTASGKPGTPRGSPALSAHLSQSCAWPVRSDPSGRMQASSCSWPLPGGSSRCPSRPSTPPPRPRWCTLCARRRPGWRAAACACARCARSRWTRPWCRAWCRPAWSCRRPARRCSRRSGCDLTVHVLTESTALAWPFLLRLWRPALRLSRPCGRYLRVSAFGIVHGICCAVARGGQCTALALSLHYLRGGQGHAHEGHGLHREPLAHLAHSQARRPCVMQLC